MARHCCLQQAMLIAALAAACCVGGVAAASPLPLLHPMFSNHMVLQQNSTGAIFGWAPPGVRITVKLEELQMAASGTAGPDGRWLAKLGALAAGGPYRLTVLGPSTSLTLSDVMVGEVWLVSGQSNAKFTFEEISGKSNYWAARVAAELANASASTPVRVFNASAEPADQPQALLGGAWNASSRDSLYRFSGLAYLFGKDLAAALAGGVTVGVVSNGQPNSWAVEWLDGREVPALANLSQLEAEALPRGGPPGSKQILEAGWFNALTYPLAGFAFKGVLWYQGENDAGFATSWSGLPQFNMYYGQVLPALLASWRDVLGDPALPFLIVQLPNYGLPQAAPVEAYAPWAAVREAQRLVVQADPASALVVTIDLGHTADLAQPAAIDLHQPNKWAVADRATTAALALAYGVPRQADAQGPLYRSFKVESDGRVRIAFDSAASGLMVGRSSGDAVGPVQPVAGGQLANFAIQAQGSSAWVNATAAIDPAQNSTVLVSAAGIGQPGAVRLGWANNPLVNLYNRDGLPAAPFRTDTPSSAQPRGVTSLPRVAPAPFAAEARAVAGGPGLAQAPAPALARASAAAPGGADAPAGAPAGAPGPRAASADVATQSIPGV